MISRHVKVADNNVLYIEYASSRDQTTIRLDICQTTKPKDPWQAMRIEKSMHNKYVTDAYIPHAGHWKSLSDGGGITGRFAGNEPYKYHQLHAALIDDNICITPREFDGPNAATSVDTTKAFVLPPKLWKVLVADLRLLEEIADAPTGDMIAQLRYGKTVVHDMQTLPQQLFTPRQRSSI